MVKNPISLLNVEEWIKMFGHPDDKNILVCLVQKNNYYQKAARMKSLIEEEDWHRVVWFFPHTYKSKKVFKQKDDSPRGLRSIRRVFDSMSEGVLFALDLWGVIGITKAVGYCDNAVFVKGALSEQLVARVNPARKYLTDSSKKILNFRVVDGYFVPASAKAGEGARRILRLPILEMNNVSVFSSYGCDLFVKHELISHSFSIISQRIESKPRGNLWVLAGNPMSEYFGVSVESYVRTIAEGCKVLGLSSSDMVYAAHPGKESGEKLERLKSELNCIVDDDLLPLEMRIAHYSHKPKAFVGFWSGSLLSLAHMGINGIDFVSLWHPQFDKFSYLRQWRSDVEATQNGQVRFLDLMEAPDIIEPRRIDSKSDSLVYFDNLAD